MEDRLMQRKDEIINFVENKIGTSTSPVDGPSYILPDGKFLTIWKSKIPVSKYSATGSAIHRDVQQYLYDNGLVKEDSWVDDPELDKLGCIRVNGGFEEYIWLPDDRPNETQWDSLLVWLDWYFRFHHKLTVGYYHYAPKTYFDSDYTTDEILKKCKEAYGRGYLTEEMIEGGQFDMFATQSAYEAKQYLLNHKNESWRVFIDEQVPLYLIGRPYECTHTMMVDLAKSEGYNTRIDDNNPKVVCAIFSTKDEYGWEEVPASDAYEDDYRYGYWWDDFVFYSRYIPFSGFELYKEFKSEFGTPTFGRLHESINEKLLLEKSRQELINKSKSSDDYSANNQAKGRNRWERRKHSQIATSVRDYNRIDMDAFWKGDILEFGVKVHGETNDYVVMIIFENILDELQREVKANNNKLEFKCVLRALLKSFNGDRVYVSCSCPDWKYRQAYWATKDGYSSGAPEVRPSDITNPRDSKGGGCKHVNLVISNADWMMKIASVINNYIKWCKQNMERNYADYIFPKVYGMPYNRAVQLSIFDDMDSEDSGLLPSDQKTLDTVIDRSMQGRGEKGKWAKGNEYRFQPKAPKEPSPEDNPDQYKLDLEFPKKSRTVKEPEVEVETEVDLEDEEANIRPRDVNKRR